MESLEKICSLNISDVYNQCKNIISTEVKEKKMGWIYKILLEKSILDKLFFCEYEKGPIIAFAICRKLIRKNIISVDKFGVHPRWRRHGIGKRLMNRIKDNHLPLRVDVVSTNIDAIEFYKKCGFVRINGKVLGKNIIVDVMMWGNLGRGNLGSPSAPSSYGGHYDLKYIPFSQRLSCDVGGT